MAIRKIAQTPTAKDRAIADRVKRARAVKTPTDRTTNYHEALGELARAADVPVDLLIEEWSERSAVREYLGGVTKAEAEFLAMDDVRQRFGR